MGWGNIHTGQIQQNVPIMGRRVAGRGARQVVTTLTNGTRFAMFLKWNSAASDNVRKGRYRSVRHPILSCFIASRTPAIRPELDMCILYSHALMLPETFDRCSVYIGLH